jgi:hypothetical protein
MMTMGMGTAQPMRRSRSAGEISTCLGVADEALWQRRAGGTLHGHGAACCEPNGRARLARR